METLDKWIRRHILKLSAVEVFEEILLELRN